MSTWSSWSALPSGGAFCGVTTTARVAGVPGWPLVLRNWDAAYACSIVAALVPWSPAGLAARGPGRGGQDLARDHLGGLLLVGRAGIQLEAGRLGHVQGGLVQAVLRGTAGVEELGLQVDLPGDGRTRVDRGGADAADHRGLGARLGDDQQPAPGQQVAQHGGLDRLGVQLALGGLLLGGVPLAADLAELVLQLRGGLVQQAERGPLQLGRAEDDPDRQREEHRHDGDEMVAKVDH